MIGNAAIKAGLTIGLVAAIALPAAAQTSMQQTVIEQKQTTGGQTTVQTTQKVEQTTAAPAVVQTIHAAIPAAQVAAPACVNRTITLGATVAPIPVIPIAVPRCTGSYLPSNFESSQDFIWEPFGPETDEATPSFGGMAGG